jgi:hypothetical protein
MLYFTYFGAVVRKQLITMQTLLSGIAVVLGWILPEISYIVQRSL